VSESPPNFFQRLVANGELKLNRKLGIYIICLLLSCLLWMLITLSERYDTDIIFPVSYSNIPKSKVVINRLPETITATVNAVGFNLLWYKLKGHGDSITMEIPASKLREHNGNYYTLTNNRLEKISAQLGDKIKVLRISPDTIYVDFAEKLKRKLHVKPNTTLTLQKQYGLSDSIKTEPEFVNVAGPKSIVERMQYAETEKITLNDVSDNQQIVVKFKKPENSEAVTFLPETVKLIVPVEKYTEGTVEIPVTVRNLPKGSRLKVIPEKVKVTYLVGLSKYDKVNAGDFTVGFNYKNLPKGKGNKIKLEVLGAPSSVNSVKVEPVSVEYIIQK
jgi:YbbR domain-containing protein